MEKAVENSVKSGGARALGKIALLVLVVWGFIYIISEASNGVMSLKSVPDFKVMGLGGETITKSQVEGRDYVISFWATWCGACAREMDLFNRMKAELDGEKIGFLAIASDENPKRVQRYAMEKKLAFPVALDYFGTAIDTFGVKYLPVTLFVDHAGGVRKVVPGMLNDREMREGMALLK